MISILIPFLLPFWFVRSIKQILFWIYLWQLKEYHIGRFVDHFRTEKGKKLILNKLNLIKVLILLPFFFFLVFYRQHTKESFFNFFLGVLIILYLIELLFFLKNIFQKNLKTPVLTKKAIFLIFIGLLVTLVFLIVSSAKSKDIFYLALSLLVFDILTPLVVSLIVLLMQPIVVLLRNQIIKKAAIKRAQYKNLIVVGITGSYGKTSVKEFLAAILSEKFRVLKTREHQNSEVGISQCILKELKPEHQIFVAEMAAYGKGGIKLLSDIIKPEIGILTGINEQHLALFGSQEDIINTKYELIESLPQKGIAIFNGDNKYCLELYKKTNTNKRIYSTRTDLEDSKEIIKPDVWAENIKIEKDFVSFKAKTKGGESSDFKVNALGSHSVLNILAAITAAMEFGMTLQEISKVTRKITLGQGAMRVFAGKENISIIDSGYSANPDGVVSDLNYLKIYSGKKVIIMPCLIELGNASKEVHFRLGKKIGEVCNKAIITTKERLEDIKAGAIEAGMTEDNVSFIENPEEIATAITVFCTTNDAVLLEGRVPKELVKLLSF